MRIHPSAVVDKEAMLAEDVEIGPGACVQSGVRLGAGCRIGPNAVVFRGVTLGNGCRVHACAVIGDDPQDLAFKGGESFVVVGDNCVIREGVTIHRGTKEGTTTRIGNDCFLMACSHVAHNCELGDRVILANSAVLGGYAHIGERVFISGNCSVHQFCRVGRLAMLGGNSAVSKDVPPFTTVASEFYNRLRSLNIVGMRRAGFTAPDRLEVKRAYRTFYFSGLNRAQAIERLKQEGGGGPLTREIVDFFEASKRGICGWLARAAQVAGEELLADESRPDTAA